ncbi:encapsulin-associated ferritin-like protein [Celerinatantimonas yamalensis]|uniref:Encapsulin-associated ferritin-like protein n=1 Tax=Celerinatantimonas yamalensis TaxID=559956 RepID=A0ABW9G9E8_9GAMM
MSSESIHEPIEKLSQQTIELHRGLMSLQEELEAVDWYSQRVDASDNAELKSIMAHNRDEEIEHAAMMIEWLRRNNPMFAKQLKKFLFTDKPIAEHE